MLCPVRICKHEGKQKYLYKMRRRAGSAPHPLPPLRWRSQGGRGGGEAGELCPAWGILSRVGGIFGLWVRRVTFACGFGVSLRQDILAGLLGGSVWRVKWAHLFNRFGSKGTYCWAKRNRKEWNVLWWICRLRYHYVVSNIVLFALLQVHQNQQIVVLKPWLCGSVNLTANENIHHEEERTAFYCCSARFCWSRHQPGYVQGGQEVGRGYLLLGVQVRRIQATHPQ